MKSRRKLIIILLAIVIAGLATIYGVMLFLQNGDGENSSFIRDFLPFGSPAENSPEDFSNTTSDGSQGQFGDESSGSDSQTIFDVSSDLKQITDAPTTSGVVYEKDSVPHIRYIIRETGLVSDTNIETGDRSSVTTDSLQDVIDALWLNKTTVAVRSLENEIVSTSIVSINESAQTISSIPLEEGIEEIVIYQNGFAYIKGSSIKKVTVGGAVSTVATLPISGWSITSSGQTLYTYPKASSGVESAVYAVNSSGLTKQSEGFGIVAEAGSGGVQISQNISLQNTNLSTVADKCAVGSLTYCAVPKSLPSGSYPDDWYKGVVSFSDVLWVIDTETSGVRQLTDLSQSDGTQLKISQDESFLSFIDKKNGSLWVYKLPNTDSIESGGLLPPPPPII